jgi:hypothetical protein
VSDKKDVATMQEELRKLEAEVAWLNSLPKPPGADRPSPKLERIIRLRRALGFEQPKPSADWIDRAAREAADRIANEFSGGSINERKHMSAIIKQAIERNAQQ